MSDRLKLPPVRDFGFYQRRKHDKWREVEAPVLEAPVADSHAHIHMLFDPAWELARCAANNVGFACMIVDPTEDGARPFEKLAEWESQAASLFTAALPKSGQQGLCQPSPAQPHVQDEALANERDKMPANVRYGAPELQPFTQQKATACDVRIATGVHPHNAKLYDNAIEQTLLEHLEDGRVCALGEIGLDYHYDLSPRDTQRRVFLRQIQLAKEAHMPIALHLRSGEDPLSDNAHAEAFALLKEVGFPEEGTLLHCCALPPEELKPWIDAGCFIAYGGAITFKSADAARAGVKLVPDGRLLLETDAPYMTPEPMRGAACTPAHVVFTAVALADIRGIAPGEDRCKFLGQLYANTLGFYRIG